MASMRTLNRRLDRWHRYAARTYWNPRYTAPRWLLPRSAVLCSPGHVLAWDARERERERRQCFRFYVGRCLDCGLPDLHNGIGSCGCIRCEGCDCDWAREGDDEGRPPGVVTEHAFAERGLL